MSGGTVPADPALAVLTGTLFLLGTFTPGLVALALTARMEGRAATHALFAKIYLARHRDNNPVLTLTEE